MCWSLFLNKVAGQTAEVFSCEYCEILKNTFFTEHFRTTVSGTKLPSSMIFRKIMGGGINHFFN